MQGRFGSRDDQNKNPQRVVVSVGKPQGGSGDDREIIQDARDEAHRIVKAAEDEARKVREQSIDIEKRIVQKEEELDSKQTQTSKLQSQLESAIEAYKKQEEAPNQVRQDLIKKLEKVSSLTREEGKKLILENLESELKDEIAKRIRSAEEEIRQTAKDKGRDILVNSMIAGATDWVAEYTVSTIRLESEELKGRIIGKEGRNIRSFELATGVDVELDGDIPEEVRLSSFDPVRREIARVALEWLVKDARIQPTRIEQLVEEAKELVAKDMSEAGKKAAHELGLYNIPQEALDRLGRLKFRYSYGQNQLIASIETGKIAKKIAEEVGADPLLCAWGGLYHDIGKTEMEKEGTHVQLGIELAERWKFPVEVRDAIAQHHEDEPFSRIESIVVHLADAISGARPGARHEAVEDYIKRLTDIENVALSFEGVEKAFAIQAGREVRVIVEPKVIDDAGIVILARDIKEKLEKELTYPGQITVTVIREVRAIDIAK
ncbi:ribonuclease Y [Candidatus Curtissbacteria bacterium]|nr:ribonuclease Y [Candidatus Curtissbacteria bacterium]